MSVRKNSGKGQLSWPELERVRHTIHYRSEYAFEVGHWLAHKMNTYANREQVVEALEGYSVTPHTRESIRQWCDDNPVVIDIAQYELPDYLPHSTLRKRVPRTVCKRLVDLCNGSVASYLAHCGVKPQKVLQDAVEGQAVKLAVRARLAVLYSTLIPKVPLNVLGRIMAVPLDSYLAVPYISDNQKAIQSVLLKLIPNITDANELEHVRQCVRRRIGFLEKLREIGREARQEVQY